MSTKSKKQPSLAENVYHHGDLRNALIVSAAEIIEASGSDNFSMIEAARKTGVSSAAPYRHFKDKDDLLESVAELGFYGLNCQLEAQCKEYQIVVPCRLHRQILSSVGMQETFYLLFHLLTTLAKLLRPSGNKAIIAENFLLKQQLIIHCAPPVTGGAAGFHDQANGFSLGQKTMKLGSAEPFTINNMMLGISQ